MVPDGCGCRGCWLCCRWWLWREGLEGGVFGFVVLRLFLLFVQAVLLLWGGECVLMPSAGFMVVGVGGGVKFVGVSACFSFRCGFGWVLLSAGASGFVACVRVWCGYCCWLMMVSRWRSVSTVATSCSLIMVCPHCGQVMPRCWRAWLAGMGCVLCPQWSHLGVMVVMSAVHVAWAPHLGQVMVCPGVAVFWSCLACWLVGWYPHTAHVGVMMVVLMVLLFMVGFLWVLLCVGVVFV